MFSRLWRCGYVPWPIRLRGTVMTALDATGMFAIEEVAKQLHAGKRTLILCGAREQPAQLIHQAEFLEVGKENICENVQHAPRRAEEVYERVEAKFVGGETVRASQFVSGIAVDQGSRTTTTGAKECA
jgi:hypothetical protein